MSNIRPVRFAILHDPNTIPSCVSHGVMRLCGVRGMYEAGCGRGARKGV